MSDFPYPGLRPFARNEADIFFGREEHINRLLEKLGQTRFVAVFGPSGFGKSSLVQAGLFRDLEAGFLASAGPNWRIAEMRPGHQPFARLAQALSQKAALDIAAHPLAQQSQEEAALYIQAILRRGPLGLKEVLDEMPISPETNLLVLVDQFEEIFRYHRDGDPEETTAFVALLIESAKQKDWPIYVVITMRSDFLGDCTLFLDLPEVINEGQFLTPRLTRDQLQEAIEAPTSMFHGQIESALVNRLLNDAGTHPDQLPLLQHVLMRMWTLAPIAQPPQQGKILTLAAYERMGGFNGVLSRHADEALAELTHAQRVIAEHLFRALCERGSDQRDTRHPQRFQTVQQSLGISEDELRTVIDVFRTPERSFITPPRPHPLTADTVLDISHESLIRQWRTLQGWVEQEARSAEIYLRLEETARLWKQGQAALWSSPDLDIALQWKEREAPNAAWAERYGTYFDLAMRFLDASIESQAAQRQAEAAAQQREEEAERRRQQLASIRRQRRFGILAFQVVLIFALWALWERNTAQKESQRAEVALTTTQEAQIRTEAALVEVQTAKEWADQARQHVKMTEQHRTLSLFESRLTHAALLARVEDYAAMQTVLKETRELDKQIPAAYRHARNLLARFGAIMGGGSQQVYEGVGVPLYAAAVSPDGRLLGAVGENGTVVLFDMESGALRQRLDGHSRDVNDVVFHPQGAWLASAGQDQQIIRWSLPSGNTPAKQLKAWKSPANVSSLAVSPTGELLASGDENGIIRLWQAETGKLVRRLEGHRKGIAEAGGLAFSSSGKFLASSSYDNTARVWDVARGKTLQVLKGHNGSVFRAAFSPDEKRIATSSADRRLILWEVESGQLLQVFEGHQNTVFGVDFVPRRLRATLDPAGGQGAATLLVSPSQDRTLRVWDTDSGVTLRVLQGHIAGVLKVAIHAAPDVDHRVQVFSASNDGTVRRWAIASLPYQQLVDLPGSSISAAITPSGQHVAVGFDSGALRLYALPEMRVVEEQEKAHSAEIRRLSFNADGTLLASASFDNTAKLWAVAPDGSLTERQTCSGHTGAVYGLAFSPDGTLLATASHDGRVGLFTVGTEEKRFIDAHEEHVNSVEFDHSGNRLLSAGDDKTARLWNLTTNPPTQIQAFKAQDMLMWATLSPDGQAMASVGRGSSRLQVYSTNDAQLLHRLVGHESTVYRAIFSPDGHQLATVSADATLRLWDLGTGGELFSLRLPTHRHPPVPLWDFDFRCTPTDCWIAVPLTRGKLALYEFGTIYD
jgi:WD40 repeat protein